MRRLILLTAAVVLVVAVAGAAMALARPGSAAAVGSRAGPGSSVGAAPGVLPATGAILFGGGPAGSSVYAVDSRGGVLKRLGASSGTVYSDGAYPQWAPDGRRYAFVGRLESGSGEGGLYVTRADGTHPRRIAAALHDEFSWSPDGTRIVLKDARDVDAGRGVGLSIVDVSSGRMRRLTSATQTWDSSPIWSPDGRRVAFLRRRQDDGTQPAPLCGNTTCAFVVDADGRSAERLVARKAYWLAWSPDGARLAVSISGAGDEGGVAVARIGARSVRSTRVVERGSWAVAWSPDGRSIGLTGWLVDERSGTFLVRPDGSGFRRVSPYGNVSWSRPSWSPDSRSLAVLDYRAPGPDRQLLNEIWVVDAGGRGARRVTRAWRYGYEAWYPRWNPKGRTTAQVDGTVVSHAIPPRSVATGNTLRVPGRIAQLVADGARVVLRADTLELWAPASGELVRFGGQYGSGYPPFAVPFNDLALAGTRIALGAFGTGGGPARYWLNTATATIPRVVRASGLCVNEGGGQCDRFGAALGDAKGDGDLIVFDGWGWSEGCGRNVCPGPKHDGELWRLDGATAVRIASGSTALTPLAVDAGRILVDHEDGTMELLRADGSRIRSFPFDQALVRAALLQGSDLAVQTPTSVEVTDAETGAFLRRWPLPADGARLVDLHGGVAVLTSGADIHLLRLVDGRASVIRTDSTTPVLAQLEESGLFYAATVDDRAYAGRVVYTPSGQLPLGP